RWTGNGSASAELLLTVNTDRMPIWLAAEYRPLNPRNSLSVFLDGNRAHDCADNMVCLVPRIDLSRGGHVLEFRSHLPPAHPDNGDPRTLGYSFAQIEIAPLR